MDQETLNYKEIKSLYEKYDLGVGFDDEFKVDNCILSTVSRDKRIAIPHQRIRSIVWFGFMVLCYG